MNLQQDEPLIVLVMRVHANVNMLVVQNVPKVEPDIALHMAEAVAARFLGAPRAPETKNSVPPMAVEKDALSQIAQNWLLEQATIALRTAEASDARHLTVAKVRSPALIFVFVMVVVASALSVVASRLHGARPHIACLTREMANKMNPKKSL